MLGDPNRQTSVASVSINKRATQVHNEVHTAATSSLPKKEKMFQEEQHSLPRALRDEVERVCLDVLGARLAFMDERLALSIADRIRRVTHEHVLSSVNGTIRRVLRDALLDQTHPLSNLLRTFRREASERRVDAETPAGRQQSAHKMATPRQEATSVARKSRASSRSFHGGEDSTKDIEFGIEDDAIKDDFFDINGIKADLVARTARVRAIPVNKNQQASFSSSVETSSSSESSRKELQDERKKQSSQLPLSGRRAQQSGTQVTCEDGLNVSNAAATKVPTSKPSPSDMVNSIARLRQLVDTLEFTE
jgi:hypothetical protein